MTKYIVTISRRCKNDVKITTKAYSQTIHSFETVVCWLRNYLHVMRHL